MHIDHVTLRTRDFLIQVFDLEEGTRPHEIRGIRGHWLYSEGQHLVHIPRAGSC